MRGRGREKRERERERDSAHSHRPSLVLLLEKTRELQLVGPHLSSMTSS